MPDTPDDLDVLLAEEMQDPEFAVGYVSAAARHENSEGWLHIVNTNLGVEIGVGRPDFKMNKGDIIMALSREGQGFAVLLTWDEAEDIHHHLGLVLGERTP